MFKDLKQAALEYHLLPKPGKIGLLITKPTETQEQLCLAYTPGVAEPVKAIAQDPECAYKYTSKGNLVAVISDGTAVLGLGNVGALAGKPVMEGKGVLFKRFADVDVFDIEVDSASSEDFINTVANISPTFGGINLEDIKAPECFAIEKALVEKLDIPVFHDDQHGTAVILAAGLLNALDIQGKKLSEVKIVCLGAGAAGIASMNLLVALGTPKQNIYMCDRNGVLHTGRTDLNSYKAEYALETDKRTLADAMQDSDVFIGVSGPNLVTADMLRSMAAKPIVFAMSNPDPEIAPAIALATRDDLILATGRGDYANQVNNVLCFPYIFRGALDVRAAKINRAMHIAAVHAIKDLARQPVPAAVLERCHTATKLEFGKQYILPLAHDPRLQEVVPPAVALAAIATKVAKLPYPAHYPQVTAEALAAEEVMA
ncbi:MAG TPA: malic enzyme-like NAD(P)-binding protein [Gammaproteobacteria bacterium]|nr:malic enzyme-like NAD(P)-binding protein [Gammaproteobacteria bacterium]